MGAFIEKYADIIYSTLSIFSVGLMFWFIVQSIRGRNEGKSEEESWELTSYFVYGAGLFFMLICAFFFIWADSFEQILDVLVHKYLRLIS